MRNESGEPAWLVPAIVALLLAAVAVGLTSMLSTGIIAQRSALQTIAISTAPPLTPAATLASTPPPPTAAIKTPSPTAAPTSAPTIVPAITPGPATPPPAGDLGPRLWSVQVDTVVPTGDVTIGSTKVLANGVWLFVRVRMTPLSPAADFMDYPYFGLSRGGLGGTLWFPDYRVSSLAFAKFNVLTGKHNYFALVPTGSWLSFYVLFDIDPADIQCHGAYIPGTTTYLLPTCPGISDLRLVVVGGTSTSGLSLVQTNNQIRTPTPVPTESPPVGPPRPAASGPVVSGFTRVFGTVTASGTGIPIAGVCVLVEFSYLIPASGCYMTDVRGSFSADVQITTVYSWYLEFRHALYQGAVSQIPGMTGGFDQRYLPIQVTMQPLH